MAVPQEIENLAKQVRTATYGKEVRESIAESMELTANVADEAIQVTEQLLDGSFDSDELNAEIKKRLNELEKEYTPRLSNAENKIDANSNKIGVLTDLSTEEKVNLVGAVNEVSTGLTQVTEDLTTYKQEHGEAFNSYTESNNIKIDTLVPKRHIFGGQLAEMKNVLANPLAQFVGIVFIGDSITWGRTLTGNGVYDPRTGKLTDPRDVFASPSFVNEFKRYVGKEYAYNKAPVLSNWSSSPSGQAIAEYNIEHILYPKNGDFNLVSTGTNMTVNEVSSGNSITGMQLQLTDNQYDGTGNHSIKFKFTGDSLTLSFAIVSGEEGYYDLIVDGVKRGTFHNTVGVDGLTAGNDKRRTHTFPFVRDKEIEIKTTRNSDPDGYHRIRIEGMIINKKIRITNQGIIGATVNSYRTFINEAVTEKDSFVICQLGTNDRIIESGKPKGSNVLRANLQYLLSSLTDKSVILMAANPAANNDPATYSFTMQDVRDVVYRVAKANSIDMVDNYAIFSELENAKYTADGLHPNELGHLIMGRNIINSMEF